MGNAGHARRTGARSRVVAATDHSAATGVLPRMTIASTRGVGHRRGAAASSSPESRERKEPRAVTEEPIDRSTPDVGDLFQDIILEHYRRPRNEGALEEPTVDVHMNNPTCGDEIHLYLTIEDGVVAEVAFEGEGCSISQASVSMMTQILKERPVSEGLRIAEVFKAMMHGDSDAAGDKDLRDARALQGVSRFPTRIKCAMLGWNAFEEATRGE